jgi:lipopolysaccharide biosynthesis glycosyltransferase
MAFPKNASQPDNYLRKIKVHLGLKKDSCIVVGNGPSAPFSGIAKELIESSHIFRANWFFLEENKYFGEVVDGFFWSVDNKKLRESLRDIVLSNSYRIRSFFQPFKSSDDENKIIDETEAFRQPQFDHWTVIATDPVLARFMMGRPLPTQGMQMIAVAAILGYKRIVLAGIDMYQDKSKRYAHDIPKEVKSALLEKDVTPGYEMNHSLDNDLMFLRTIRSRHSFELQGSEKMERLAPFFNKKFAAQSNWRNPERKANFSKNIFVTLADGEHAIGAITLARSLARVTEVPLLVLYTTESTPCLLSHLSNVILRKVAPINNPNTPRQKRFMATYTKLRIFELLEFERLVYLDADTIVRRNIDDLFESDEVLVAPDWGIELTDYFNSGMIAFSPCESLKDKIFSNLNEYHSYDGGDQGYLNEALKGLYRLMPPEYNTLKRLLINHPNLITFDDVKVLHYVGAKPWEINKDSLEFGIYDSHWASYLETDDISKVYPLWKGIANIEDYCAWCHSSSVAELEKNKFQLNLTYISDLMKQIRLKPNDVLLRKRLASLLGKHPRLDIIAKIQMQRINRIGENME